MKKIIIALSLCMLFITNIHSQVQETSDSISHLWQGRTWLQALDSFYKEYDMVMNTITQIDQGYQMIKMYADQAKSWQLNDMQGIDNIDDFRNELTGSIKSVNRQMNNVRHMRDLLTKYQIPFGDSSYTIADMCGQGKTGVNITDAVNSVMLGTESNFEQAAVAWSAGLTPEQGAAIWRKWGLYPKNYAMVYNTEKAMGDIVGRVIAAATDDAKEMMYDNQHDNALKTLLSETIQSDSITDKEVLQKQLVYINECIDKMKDLKGSVDDLSAMYAWQQQIEKQKEQAERDAENSANRTSNVRSGIDLF
jgi:hypothetical protein